MSVGDLGGIENATITFDSNEFYCSTDQYGYDIEADDPQVPIASLLE